MRTYYYHLVLSIPQAEKLKNAIAIQYRFYIHRDGVKYEKTNSKIIPNYLTFSVPMNSERNEGLADFINGFMAAIKD